ncbi:MAG TPA: NAD-dependent epimerase/dehydratase family protein [Chloroflexota bacterium]
MSQPDTGSDVWRNRRVLVTGATGLVGGWLVEALLAAGARVAALVRDQDHRSQLYRSGAIGRVMVVTGDVADLVSVERAIDEDGPDTVVHLAAQPIVQVALRSPLATFETNVRGTYNLLEACRRRADVVRRVALASSDKAYGDHGETAYVEEAPLRATGPYDVSKACGDMIARGYAATYGTPVAIARCGNIYGGGDLNWSRIVPGTIRALHRGERPLLRSDGTSVRDYLYVRDAVSAYLRLAADADREGVRGRAFNFSAEAPLSVLGMVEKIADLMGRPDLAPTIEVSARAEIPYQRLSAGRARDVLGWAPCHDLGAGLRETIDWYRAFFAGGGGAP